MIVVSKTVLIVIEILLFVLGLIAGLYFNRTTKYGRVIVQSMGDDKITMGFQMDRPVADIPKYTRISFYVNDMTKNSQ